MAAPVNVAITHKTVTKIATNVTSADIHIKQGGKNYYGTYVLTGIAAPSAPDPTNNPDLDYTGLWVEMDSLHQFRPSAASDFYIWISGGDSALGGNVRVDV